MKKHTTSISMQTSVTKAVNHYSTYPNLFADSHLLTSRANLWANVTSWSCLSGR